MTLLGTTAPVGAERDATLKKRSPEFRQIRAGAAAEAAASGLVGGSGRELLPLPVGEIGGPLLAQFRVVALTGLSLVHARQ